MPIDTDADLHPRVRALAESCRRSARRLARERQPSSQIDGAERQAAWVERHRFSCVARREYCPCLLGTSRQMCGCDGASAPPSPLNAGRISHLIRDHYRTWIRDGIRTVWTTEPYAVQDDLPRRETIDFFAMWSARTGMPTFFHPPDEGFHNPGRCALVAVVEPRYADEYGRLEPSAYRLRIQ